MQQFCAQTHSFTFIVRLPLQRMYGVIVIMELVAAYLSLLIFSQYIVFATLVVQHRHIFIVKFRRNVLFLCDTLVSVPQSCKTYTITCV